MTTSTHSSDVGLRALALARCQVGVCEASGKNDGVPAERYADGREEPWCADFAAWLFRTAGRPLPGHQVYLRSVQYMEDQCKKAGWWVSTDKAVPTPGDLVFFATRKGSDAARRARLGLPPPRHVEILERHELGVLHNIGGNLGNSVRTVRRRRDDPEITGFVRVPDFTAA